MLMKIYLIQRKRKKRNITKREKKENRASAVSHFYDCLLVKNY